MITRAAIYTRVSTDDQVRGASIDVQLERCRHEAERQGWEIVGEFRDEGVSGAVPPLERPGFAAAVAARPEVILVMKWDRYTRENASGQLAAQDLLLRGIELRSADEPGSDPFTRDLHMLLAKKYRDDLVQRTMASKRHLARKGHWVQGVPPFGHTIDDEKLPIVHEGEAAVLRRAAELILDHGLTHIDAAQRLNDEGLLPRPTKHNGVEVPLRWKPESLRRALMLPSVGGRMIWGKDQSRRKVLAREERIEFDVPPVIEPARHAVLVGVLQRSARGPYSKRRVYALSGRLRSPCGEVYSGCWGTTTRGGYRYYRCRNKEKPPYCEDPLLNADWIEEQVWGSLYELFIDDERLLALLPKTPDDALAAAREVGRLRERIANLDEARTSRAAELLAAGVEAAVVQGAIAKLGRDVETLQEQLAEMEDWAKVAEMADSQREWLRQFNQLWPRLLRPSPEARREVFALLDVQVTVLGTERQPKLHIDGAIPPDSVTLDAVSRAIVGNPASGSRR